MAKYSKKAGDKVERAMHEMKEGKLKSGRSGQKVKSRKQAIAIGLSEAREEGAKVPKKKPRVKKPLPVRAALKRQLHGKARQKSGHERQNKKHRQKGHSQTFHP